MKSLIFVLCLLGFSPAFAGPGDDPIFPWPTSMERGELLAEDIQGEWVGYGNDEKVYFVIFTVDPETNYRVSIVIETLDGEPERKGLGYWGRHVFWGHISMDRERYTRMVLYRERGSLQMRIENKLQDGYVDMRLERAPWNLQ